MTTMTIMITPIKLCIIVVVMLTVLIVALTVEDKISLFQSSDSCMEGVVKEKTGQAISPKKDVSVSMIVLASGQRSSSSFLSKDIMGGMNCHVSLNEITNPEHGQSGDAWEKEGKEMGMDFKWAQNDPADMATFILRVGKRRCREMLRNGGGNNCRNHCWLNYKHFEFHVADWQKTLLWNALWEQTVQQQSTHFAMAILERKVEERWRSHWFAQHTGDWNTEPGASLADHQAKIESAHVPPVQASFLKKHNEWFRLVRGYAQSMNSLLKSLGQPQFPVVDLSFEQVTKQPTNVTQRIIQKEIINFHY